MNTVNFIIHYYGEQKTILSELVLIIIMFFSTDTDIGSIYLLEILNTILRGWRHCNVNIKLLLPYSLLCDIYIVNVS